MALKKSNFVVCVDNEGADDLTKWKLYRLLPDKAAATSDWVRIVDDSGEDYLYPSECFAPVDVSPAVAKKLMATSV